MQKLLQLFTLDNKGVHNFSLGCLDAYFELNKGIAAHEVSLINDHIIHFHKRKKVYVFGVEQNIDLLKSLQKDAVVYSINPIKGLEKHSKFTEIAYNLEEVFNLESYPTKKKRYNKLIYPFRWIKNHTVTVNYILDSKEVKSLHDKWVEHKVSDPATYRIMFPNARYFRCYEQAVVNCFSSQAVPVDYRVYGFFSGVKLVLVRVVSVQNSTAYDLANFGNTWDSFSQLSNYADIWVLKDLYEQGVVSFNCGAMLNKNLKAFKTHYPYHEVISHMYGRVKSKKKEVANVFFK